MVYTFYADATDLPEQVRKKAEGFDWRAALGTLERSVRKYLNADMIVVTDKHTPFDRDVLRVGDARRESVIMWLLDAQAMVMREAQGRCLLISPDTLIAGPLDFLFGAAWDVCLLTRPRPKAIVNSVIAATPTAALGDMWTKLARAARALPPDARAWGADLDAVIAALRIQPSEHGVREVEGVRARFQPIDGLFKSVRAGRVEQHPEVIWDFKGARKAVLPQHAALLGCAL